jgi:hypothetical protein
MKRRITYPHAQVRLLVRAVRRLTEQLKRPVCTKDLKAHWNQHPGDRPELLQRTGQTLIKAARPVSQDRLYRIGLIGNLAYYAADNDPFWKRRLAAHEADLAIENTIKDPFPNHMSALRGGPHEALALNAVAGWAVEMERYLKHASETFSAGVIQNVLNFGLPNELPAWAGISPSDLIGKEAAIQLLTGELSRRAPFKLELRQNWYRYLSPWRWPQSILFQRPDGAPVYSRRQLTLLAMSLWPEAGEDGELARAELLALRYGLPSAR